MRGFLEKLGLRAGKRQVERSGVTPDAFPPPAPDGVLAVIGDIHGSIGPFERLLARIEAEHPAAQVICVGDLIDRGEASDAVLRRGFSRRESLVVLLGNHEEMLLRFLDAPEQEAARWLRNGGLQTLASFGLAPPRRGAGEDGLVALRDGVRAALGPEMEAWLRGLPRSWFSGNILVAHAGADPWLPVTQQAGAALTWGHPDFGHRRRTDGIWVAHGHTIVPEPQFGAGQISVDTGAYAGGGLSAAIVARGDVQFLCEPS